MDTTTLVLIGAATSLALGWGNAHAQVPAQPVAPPTAVVQTTTVVQTLPTAKWTAPQVRQAFDLADTDSNGELSRAESQKLIGMPKSFEDMDTNKDGSLSRAEYEAAFVR